MNRTNAVKVFVGVLLACCVGLQPAEAASKKLKVFILAGQSNMEGQGSVDHDDERDSNGGKGNLVWSMRTRRAPTR